MDKRVISIIAVTICLTSLVMGCSIHLVPNEIPRLDSNTGLAGPFNNVRVTLVNAQADDSNYSVKFKGGRDTGYVLSRRLWTEKLVEALGAELKARQGNVSSAAPVAISLKITEVTYPRNVFGKVYFDATASVTSNSGWTKTYAGTGDAATVGSKGWNRAANWTITNVVRAIMSDPEFSAELNRQK